MSVNNNYTKYLVDTAAEDMLLLYEQLKTPQICLLWSGDVLYACKVLWTAGL